MSEITKYDPVSVIFDGGQLDKIMALAKIMADGQVTVPKHLAGKPSDCLAVIMQAAQWGMNPYAVAQKTHVINGVLGYEAQLVNAVVQSSGMINGAFRYEYRGEGAALECRVGAVLMGESELTWGQWLSASSVKVKNSPLWQTNPAQQLAYLQVKNWARLYCPGAILGVYSSDELAAAPAEREINPIDKTAQVLASARQTEAVEAELFNVPVDVAGLGVFTSGNNEQSGVIDNNWLASKIGAMEPAEQRAKLKAATSSAIDTDCLYSELDSMESAVERAKIKASIAMLPEGLVKSELESAYRARIKKLKELASRNWQQELLEAGSVDDILAVTSEMPDAIHEKFADEIDRLLDLFRDRGAQ